MDKKGGLYFVRKIRVAVAGIKGKMGTQVAKTVLSAPDMELVAGIERVAEQDFKVESVTVPVFDSADACFPKIKPHVVVDFTHATAAAPTIETAIAHLVRPVIGTTGLSPDFLREVGQALEERSLGGLYAPNFAIGALLMMRAAELAARYLPYAEIVEYHHDQKRDAPSGTAQKTAERMAKARKDAGVIPVPLANAAALHNVLGTPIHSVRLPGFVAHQEVIFGGTGERLTIRHDSMSRESFMPGVLLGVRQVMNVTGLIDGLEHFLF